MAHQLETKKRLPAWMLVALPGIPLALAAALFGLSPPLARIAAEGLQAARAAPISRNGEYFFGVLFGSRHLVYLWSAIVLLAVLRRRHPAVQGFVLLAVATAIGVRALSGNALLLAALVSWIPGPPKTTTALVAWFLVACAGPVLTKHPEESYFLEASIPAVLLTGLALSDPVRALGRRMGTALGRALPRPSLRIGLAGLLIGLAGIGAAAALKRVYERDLLPHKVHGEQFREANEWLISNSPRNGVVYVLDNRVVYPKGMEGYMKRYRRFAVRRPDCWFSGFGRPDVRVLPWTPDVEPGPIPGCLFASNDYEKRYCLERRPDLASRVLFENPGCAVYDLGVSADAEAEQEAGAASPRLGGRFGSR